MNIEDYEAVKRWFTKLDGSKRYRSTTEREYLKYLKMWCSLTDKTPNELARVDAEAALKLQVQIAVGMKKLRLKDHSAIMRITSLHVFWRSNGLMLTAPIMKYDGLPWLQRLIKAKKES